MSSADIDPLELLHSYRSCIRMFEEERDKLDLALKVLRAKRDELERGEREDDPQASARDTFTDNRCQ